MKTVDGMLIVQPTYRWRDRIALDAIAEGVLLWADTREINEAEANFMCRVLDAVCELPDDPPAKLVLGDEADFAELDFSLTPAEAGIAAAAIKTRADYMIRALYDQDNPLHNKEDPGGWIGSAAISKFEIFADRYS